MASIVPVVEGPGDVAAVPILLRRVLQERFQRPDIQVSLPKKASGKHKLLRDLERYLSYAALTPDSKAALVLLDADEECSKDLAVTLAGRSRDIHLNIPIAVVCAKSEYETWFLASLETVKSKLGLPESVAFRGSMENRRGVKEWLTQRMPAGRAYKETTDQASLSAAIDLDLAYRRSRSFRRLCHAVEQLVDAMDKGRAIITP